MYARSRIHTTHTYIHTGYSRVRNTRILHGGRRNRVYRALHEPRGVDRRVVTSTWPHVGSTAALAATSETSTLLEYIFLKTQVYQHTFAIVSLYICNIRGCMIYFNKRIVSLIRKCSLHASYRYRDSSISAINKTPRPGCPA
jgi:hypothetical protein